MNREELISRLGKYEWSDIEFKEALRSAPRSSYKTVSAFANTAGGWLVFGVRDQGGAIEVVGVIETDRVQNEFLDSPFESWSTDQRWTDRVVVEENLTEQADTYLLADHLKKILDAARSRQSASDRVGGESRDLVSDQVGTTRRDLVTPLLTTLTDDQRKIIALCTVSRKRAYLMRETGFTHRTFFGESAWNRLFAPT